MENRIAKAISIVFNPVIIPTLGVLILFNLETFIGYSIPPQAKRIILIIVIINTAIAPLFVIYFFKMFGFIKSMQLDQRKERILPMIVVVFFYFFAYYILKQANLPSLVHFYFLAATLLVIISLFITMKWKISLHMISMGGLTGLLLVTAFLLKIDIPLLITAAVIVSGLVGSSRLQLNSHTLSQVCAGYSLGVSFMIILYMAFTGF